MRSIFLFSIVFFSISCSSLRSKYFYVKNEQLNISLNDHQKCLSCKTEFKKILRLRNNYYLPYKFDELEKDLKLYIEDDWLENSVVHTSINYSNFDSQKSTNILMLSSIYKDTVNNSYFVLAKWIENEYSTYYIKISNLLKDTDVACINWVD